MKSRDQPTTKAPSLAQPYSSTDSAPTLRDTFAVAWPLTLKAIMLHGIIVIDALLVAGLGEEAVAALGLAGAMVGILIGIIFSFSNATQIRIAQFFGAGSARSGPTGLKSAFFSGLIINLTSVLLGIVLIWAIGSRIIEGFAQSPWIADQAGKYLGVFLFVALSEAVGQCLGSFFNGCGKTKLTFQSYLIAMPINVALSIILIHGHYGAPALGVVGAAYGSAIASVTRVLFLGWQLHRHNRMFRDIKGWSNGGPLGAMKRHLVFSLPIAGTFLSMTIGTQVCVLIYARMSINAFAAMTLIMPWVQVAGTVGMGWAQATGITVAQLLGAQTDNDTLDQYLSRAWRAAFVAAGIVAAIYFVICLASPWIYSGLEPETQFALLLFLPTLLLLPFPKGSNAICGHTLRASGDTFYVMNIFIAGQWVFKVPMTLLFVLVLDLSVGWVFALFVFEEFFKFPLFHRRLNTGRWKQAQILDA